MITVHHLNNSRSQRVLWLLEELRLPYRIEHYQRNATTNLAPPELLQVHPLGKSPVVTDGDVTVAETGAVIEYLVERADGRLRPASGTPEHRRYTYWLHFAEGSAMLPLLMALYMGMLGDAAEALRPRVDSEIANHLSYMENALGPRDFFVGNELTGADIMLTFVTEAAGERLSPYPGLVKYRDRMHARPAYKRAIEKGGPYQLMGR